MFPYQDLPKRLLDDFRSEDRRTIVDFFVVFSRFEYALKRAGYLTNGRDSRALPNWDRFASDLKDVFDPSKSSELQEAVRYLSRQPPRKQIISGGRLDWEANPQNDGEPIIIYLLRLIRHIRNNLFHGEKLHTVLEGHPDTRERNLILLRSSLIILYESLNLSPRVQEVFVGEMRWVSGNSRPGNSEMVGSGLTRT